jgi:hypothetical protein
VQCCLLLCWVYIGASMAVTVNFLIEQKFFYSQMFWCTCSIISSCTKHPVFLGFQNLPISVRPGVSANTCLLSKCMDR